MPKPPPSGNHPHPEYATNERVDAVEQKADEALAQAGQAAAAAASATAAAAAATQKADDALALARGNEAWLTDLNSELVFLTERVNEYHPEDPDPPEPPDPPDPPLPDKALLDPFIARSLSGNQYQDTPAMAAGEGKEFGPDLYDMGRGIARHARATLWLFALWKDVRLLDLMIGWLDLAKTGLQTFTGDDGEQHVGWVWQQNKNDATYYGNWRHHMDSLLTHEWIAALVAALTRANYRLDARDYWLDYLHNEWLASWQGFPPKLLTHPYLSGAIARYHLGTTPHPNMNPAWVGEAQVMIAEYLSPVGSSLVTVPGADGTREARVWRHSVGHPNVQYAAPTTYLEYVAGGQVPHLVNEGLMAEVEMSRHAAAISEFVLTGAEPVVLEASIVGPRGSVVGGIESKSSTMYGTSRYVLWALQMLGPWDDTGEIVATTRLHWDDISNRQLPLAAAALYELYGV